MSFAKYFEDDLEIAEERHALRRDENATPFAPTAYVSKLRITLITETKRPAPEKKKKRKDKRLVCCDCGTTFFFSGGEQVYFERNKLFEPKRCPACRIGRRKTAKRKKGDAV